MSDLSDERNALPPADGPGGKLCRECGASWFYAEFWELFGGRCLGCRLQDGGEALPEDDNVFF